ncbi:hypothetical protein CU254_26185 [Amycolatopsis sp. AA4]|nr:hypothetical protein CU254_26185 [Amycolatopsis sp. AA4]
MFGTAKKIVRGAYGWAPPGNDRLVLGLQRGLDAHVLDRITDGPKPEAVRSLGATCHREPVEDVAARLCPGVVVEATGAGQIVVEATELLMAVRLSPHTDRNESTVLRAEPSATSHATSLSSPSARVSGKQN